MPRLIIMLALLSTAGTASAASFDCAKAAQQDERTVCRVRTLNDRDVRMATLYALDLRFVPMGGRDVLKRDQAKWLANRRTCRGNVVCLGQAYDRRISALQAIIDTRVYPHGPF
ncbi:MAG: hypothetical protein JWP15_1198 [Alphaproteobacteria bacterium]|nr:hypothetical protein [Alphaproteobacteria bacterium]